MTWSEIIKDPVVIGAIGTMVAGYLGFLATRATGLFGFRTSLITSGSADRSAAFQELMEVVKTLRQELKDLREELDEERDARRGAEERVRLLRDELHGLRNKLTAQGKLL